MKKELLSFIKENQLSPFNSKKTQIKTNENSIFKTKDAKIVFNKLLTRLSTNFNFADTGNLFNFFEFTQNKEIIKKRQDFFKEINQQIYNSFLKEIKKPKEFWNPKYGIVAVTEDEKTFNELNKTGCPTKFLISQNDLSSLEEYDIVQVIDCETFSRALESLPQALFLDSIDEVYLERFLRILSGWKNNLDILKQNQTNQEIKVIIDWMEDLLPLLNDDISETITKEVAESALTKINENISNEIKNLTVSGESLFAMLSKSKLSVELSSIVDKAIKNSQLPQNIFIKKIPVEIDEKELDSLIKRQDAEEHTSIAEKIRKKADKLRKLPVKLEELSYQLLLFDFLSGLSNIIQESKLFPIESEEFIIEDSPNLFIDNPQPISFHLKDNEKCSILTGANSGGKTTLLEHIIQLVGLFHLGLPVNGNIKLPNFTDIYYFAKNKGSLNKGAFETLLIQMSKINPGKKTLILADEIESVTEPGVAGMIVSATADFFIKRNCFLVIATHLGKEIQKILPEHARIDGIEAKGLDENYELIVDHNPVLGRLANSTPELIIEKMANSHKKEYFNHLFDYLKKEKLS